MFNLKEANVNEELIIKDIIGTKEQIDFLEYLGMMVGSTITIIGPGALENTLLVKLDDKIHQLNPDIIRRVIVDVKAKVKRK